MGSQIRGGRPSIKNVVCDFHLNSVSRGSKISHYGSDRSLLCARRWYIHGLAREKKKVFVPRSASSTVQEDKPLRLIQVQGLLHMSATHSATMLLIWRLVQQPCSLLSLQDKKAAWVFYAFLAQVSRLTDFRRSFKID